MKKGLLVVISGPAGSGKGTVLEKLTENCDEYGYSVSLTTRAPRPGESNGKNYSYVTQEDFEKRIREGKMLEYTHYCGNYYGTPLQEANAIRESGRNLLLEIEVEGALNVKRLYPQESVLIMLLPTSFAVQEARLRGRATETEQKILERLARTREEVPQFTKYDYIVYNYEKQAAECAADIRAIVHTAHGTADAEMMERAAKCEVARHPNAARDYFQD